MQIQLFNTLSGKKEIFKPIKAGQVGMYHCGPTVYNYPHIGNIRSYILADTLRRIFEYNGFKVNQVINITDVGHLTTASDEGFGDDGEDKVEKMARTSGQDVSTVIAHYTKAFFDDLKSVNVEINENKNTHSPATIFPKATEHISEQISLIQDLERKGYTYTISDGIYFDTSKFSGYGKLGSVDIKGLMEGARLDVSEEKRKEKRNITDFALWKFSPKSETGKAARLQEWQSPWGVGFPGWHIECSAMSSKYLGETFDIHTGGIDHIPVHHNNEIAQSEAAHNGNPLAHYWVHNAFVLIKDGKMSKSKGDFLRLETLIEHNISPLAYRYWILSSQYHTQIEFSFEALEASAIAYWKLVDFLYETQQDEMRSPGKAPINISAIDQYTLRFKEIVNDDLNTAQALALVWEVTKDSTLHAIDKKMLLLDFDTVLGLDLQTQVYKLKHIRENLPEEIKERLNEREFARKEKRWADSDKIRDEISALGFSVKDTDDVQIVTPLVRI